MAGGVTPKQIYQSLIAAGASTTQAIGIMANMIAESGLNPEAVGDQGTSFGLVQQHGAQYAGLVTGNPGADMNAQIKTVAQNGGFAAANGPNGAAAAGNFSANYERCTTCQPGQASYNQRVANAATVAGWVSSGNWPTSTGSATAAAQGGGDSGSNSKDPTCAWGFSGSLLIKSVNVCVIKKTTIRHIVGGLLLINGGVVILAGAVILAASAFNHTKAGQAVQQVAQIAPVGKVASTARRAAPRQGASRQQTAQQSS